MICGLVEEIICGFTLAEGAFWLGLVLTIVKIAQFFKSVMQHDVLNHPKQGIARFFGPVNIGFFGFEFAIFLFHAIGFAGSHVHGVDGDGFGGLGGEGIFKNHDGL